MSVLTARCFALLNMTYWVSIMSLYMSFWTKWRISRLVLTFNIRTHWEMFRFAQHDILSINNVIYINDDVGKCNRLDKCRYHYTPRQYFEDNPQLRDTNTSLHPWTVGHLHRQNDRPTTPNPHLFIPWTVGHFMGKTSDRPLSMSTFLAYP